MMIYINLARHQQSAAAYNALLSSFSTRVDCWLGWAEKKKILDSFLVIVKKRCEVCQKARSFFFRIFKLYLAAPRQGERCRFFKLIVFVDHRAQSVSTKLVSNQKFFC